MTRYAAINFYRERFNIERAALPRVLSLAQIEHVTREGQPFLTLNGIQTMSARVYHLERELPELATDGVGLLRLSPQSEHMPALIATYRALLDGKADANGAAMPAGDYCNGFWHEQDRDWTGWLCEQ